MPFHATSSSSAKGGATHGVFNLVVLFEHRVSSSGLKTLGLTFDGCARQCQFFMGCVLMGIVFYVLSRVKTQYLTCNGWVPRWQRLSVVIFLEVFFWRTFLVACLLSKMMGVVVAGLLRVHGAVDFLWLFFFHVLSFFSLSIHDVLTRS